MMMRQVTSVNWSFIGDALPAFVTIALMPFTYSVAYGLIAGLLTYASLNFLLYLTHLISGGRIQPPDADLQEYWTWKPAGGHAPWFVRAAANGGKWWGEGDGQRGVKMDGDARSERSLVDKDGIELGRVVVREVHSGQSRRSE
jgi:adenine/guanine/hypoxanthine permease